MFMLAIKFILLVFSVFLGYFLGYLLTEKYPMSRYDVFKFTAFECRQCLSFHIAWVTSTLISLILEDWLMMGLGIIFALILYLGLRIDQERKTIIIDDMEDYENGDKMDK